MGVRFRFVSQTLKVVFLAFVGFIEICGADSLVMFGGMMLGDVISFVGFAGFPIDMELSLLDMIADPIEAHAHGFGALLFYLIIGNVRGSAFASLERCWGLGMAKFCQGGLDGACLFAMVE